MKNFGTDGIRKKAEEFTPAFIGQIVCGLADYAGTNIKVLVGGDTRESTEWILQDLMTALESLGIEYASVGVLSTPAINYCFYQMGFDFAIDVTASHNPYTDNGIKIFERGSESGQKLSEAGCYAIERAIEEGKTFAPVSTTDREDLHDEAVAIYKSHLREYIGDVDMSSLDIGIDCANGATSAVADTVFQDLGAKTQLVNSDASYGQSINAGCGSTHLEGITSVIKANNIKIGIAFDGDGDRVLMVDEKGNEIDGDHIIAILAEHLGLDSVAITVMANQGLLNWAKEHNIHTEIAAVGDSNVAEAMRTHGIKLGGEQSGHIILPGEPTGDGMLTALMVAKAIVESGKTLNELASTMTKYPQVIVNMEATPAQKEALKTSEIAKKILLEYNQKLESINGRLLVRPSGTENLIRITMWGQNEEEITTLANQLKNNLGVVL